MPSSSRQPPSQSLRTGAEFPRLEGTPATQMPKLGRGLLEGDDVLFFDESPPPRPKLSAVAEAKKVTGICFLQHLNLHSPRRSLNFKLYTYEQERLTPNSCLLIVVVRIKGISNDKTVSP